MHGWLQSAGETVAIECLHQRFWPLIVEAAGGRMVDSAPARPTVEVVIEKERSPFAEADAAVVTRGVVRHGDAVVFDDACASGFSLLVRPRDNVLLVRARYLPKPAIRVASYVLRTRFLLIARAVLLQYPVLWWAGVHGRAPLHVSALTAGPAVVALAGPGGVGKSTLLHREMAHGAIATSDNVAVSDGVDVYGLVEPIRVEGTKGRRTTHGRREAPWPTSHTTVLRPDRIAAVQLADVPAPSAERIQPDVVARSLITGTFMAGELRRYWAFAAALASATGVGPAQPQVEHVAVELATALPCYVVTLSRRVPAVLGELLSEEGFHH